MRHSHDKMGQPFPSIFAYCKQSKTACKQYSNPYMWVCDVCACECVHGCVYHSLQYVGVGESLEKFHLISFPDPVHSLVDLQHHDFIRGNVTYLGRGVGRENVCGGEWGGEGEAVWRGGGESLSLIDSNPLNSFSVLQKFSQFCKQFLCTHFLFHKQMWQKWD